VIADNAAGAVQGDVVTVASDSTGILGAAALVYLVPFVLFFVAYALAAALGAAGEGVRIAAGGLGFLLGIAAARLADRRQRTRQTIVFRIVSVVRRTGQD